MCTGGKSLIISMLRETHSASVAAFSCKRGPAVGGEPRVAAWSPFEARSRACGVGVWRRNRWRYPIFAPGNRGPATTAGSVSAPWSALADLGMGLGIEGRRRYRVGGHHITLESERQQEPAFLSPRMRE